MGQEKLLIERLKEILSSGENVCYLGIDLITEDYDPVILAQLAKQGGLDQILGYLAEVSAEAARHTHLPEQDKLASLYGALEGNFVDWQYLVPSMCEEGKEFLKLRTDSGDLGGAVRQKWKIYSALESDEIEDWIDLYVTKDFKQFAPSERASMDEKGVKYTRLPRDRDGKLQKSLY